MLIGRVEVSVPYNLLDISYGRAASRSVKSSVIYTKKYILRQLSGAFVVCVLPASLILSSWTHGIRLRIHTNVAS